MKRNSKRTADPGAALLDETREAAFRAVTHPARPSSGVTLGTLVGIDGDGRPLVTFAGQGATERVARHVCPIRREDAGREVVLDFENGDPRKPVILGLIQPAVAPPAVEVSLDGERLTLTAKEEIVLRCGKSSITLTRAGKVLIRGAYLLSRSSGVNRIKGGAVQIN
jgi:hypothetical protein